MSLNAKFSLTPREPFKHFYNSATHRFEYFAFLIHYGVMNHYAGITTLESSYNDNQILLACNNVGYPFPNPFPSNFYDRAVAYMKFYTDAPTDEQHLLLFHVKCYQKIGIYLNGNLVREEDCNGDETIAVLVDCPGLGVFDTFYIVPQNYAQIKGVDCYVV